MKYLLALTLPLLLHFTAIAQVNEMQAVEASNRNFRVPDDELSELELKEFEEKVLIKTEDLGYYLQIIGGKNSSYQDIMTAIDLACDLFISENARVQVSSAAGQTKNYKIREYLNRLRLTNYQKVEITWYEIGYVSRLRQDVDGKYYGTVTINQRFKGFRDNEPEYEDVTTKHIQVVLEQIEIDKINKEKYWDIKLGDISVVETI